MIYLWGFGPKGGIWKKWKMAYKSPSPSHFFKNKHTFNFCPPCNFCPINFFLEIWQYFPKAVFSVLLIQLFEQVEKIDFGGDIRFFRFLGFFKKSWNLIRQILKVKVKKSKKKVVIGKEMKSFFYESMLILEQKWNESWFISHF